MNDWTRDQARELYNLDHWGAPYFAIGDKGRLVVRPDGSADGPAVDLYDLANEAQAGGLPLPVLVRFSGILHHRVQRQCNAFAGAMEVQGYDARYTAVYPIKVNQQHSVVDEILKSGGDGVGLEAGSKPELMAVLAASQPGGLIVCNGYKDREYLRLALIGQAIGHRVYIVVEKLTELRMVIDQSKALGVEPLIGVRVRLASLGKGKWQNTGGDKSKFGLSAGSLLKVVETLEQAGLLDRLRMMHFHMGSQISNLHDIATGMAEGARLYAELRALGAGIDCVNVGGGLGVDYEGTRSRSDCSINYRLEDYATTVVRAMADVCRAHNLPTPDLVSESGRAMTAHHALLITNVLESEVAPVEDGLGPLPGDAPPVLQSLKALLDGVSEGSPVELWSEAGQLIAEAQTQFSDGSLSLVGRAQAEHMVSVLSRELTQRLNPGNARHLVLLDDLQARQADKYFCNFSLFQTMPDAWAIDQVFPVMPIHRLDERPTRRGVIEDITCDSDGRIDLYQQSDGVHPSLALHELKPGEPYLLGIFLLGAYQEILGDIHNLFGDTCSLHVRMNADGSHTIEQPLPGDGVGAVLRAVHFDPEAMHAVYVDKLKQAGLDNDRQTAMLAELDEGLRGYTYLEE